MPVISSFTIDKVIELTKPGKSQAELARMFAISRCAVQHIIKKFKRGLGIENVIKSSRPRVLSKRDERKLVNCPKPILLYQLIPCLARLIYLPKLLCQL